MGKRKYLLIVEKPSFKKVFDLAFNQIKEKLNYDLDVAVANNHVLDTSNKVYQLDEKKLSELQPLNFEKGIDPKYKVCITDYFSKNTFKIRDLLNHNSYDAVLNGCEPDKEGVLTFEHTVLSTGLDNYRKMKVHLNDFTDVGVQTALLSLNDIDFETLQK